jgi:hypothetical protein
MAKGKKKNPFWDADVLVNTKHSTDLKTDEDIDRDEVAHHKGAGDRTTISLEALMSLMRHAYIMALLHDRVMMEVMETENDLPYSERTKGFREREPITFTMSYSDWKDWDWSWMAMISYLDTESRKNPLVAKFLNVLISPERYETREEMLALNHAEMQKKLDEWEKTATPEQKAERDEIHHKFFSNDS